MLHENICRYSWGIPELFNKFVKTRTLEIIFGRISGRLLKESMKDFLLESPKISGGCFEVSSGGNILKF